MPSTSLGRNLQLCFLKPKRPPLMSANNNSHPLSTTTTTPTTSLIKNFNFLYDHQTIITTTTITTTAAAADDDDDSFSIESDVEPECGSAVDFATIFASQRLFVSSPGRSNSIVDSSSTPLLSPPESDGGEGAVVDGGIAVPTYSPDPYADFRRSMQEMVEAREVGDVRANWEYLQELLLCYLGLNPKSTHKFIVGAFADLIVTLMSPAGGDPRLPES